MGGDGVGLSGVQGIRRVLVSGSASVLSGFLLFDCKAGLLTGALPLLISFGGMTLLCLPATLISGIN